MKKVPQGTSAYAYMFSYSPQGTGHREDTMEASPISKVAANIRTQLNGVFSPDLEFCIFKVQHRLYEDHPDSYVPLEVSIGPIHHGKEGLQEMENHKKSYLNSFLKRNPDMRLEDYLKAIKGLETDTRKCYEEKICLDSEELLEMMLVDGSFIIEVLLRFFKIDGAQISPNDPIFSDLGILNRIRLDLMLLENQIPFFILGCLFNMATALNKTVSLVELTHHFFSDIMPGHKKLNGKDGHEIKHLLDLLRNSYGPLTPIEPQTCGDEPRVLKFGAHELESSASITFKKAKSGRLLDIKFHPHGVMEIPPLKILEETECLFRNFIAYEQCCSGSNTYMSDYICFMASLAHSQVDVYTLQYVGILVTPEMDDVQVCGLFNALAEEVIVKNSRSHYSRLCKKVEIHCDSCWRLWLACFCRALVSPFLARWDCSCTTGGFHLC